MPRPETYARLLIFGTVISVAGVVLYSRTERKRAPVVVGVIVGTATGSNVAAGAMVAAQKLAERRGFRGHPVEIAVEETGNDPTRAGEAAERLMANEQVLALVVQGSEAERDAITAVAERTRLAVFTVQPVLGLQSSRSEIDLGGLPNQRVAPAASWALSALGTRVLLVASDGSYQRVVDAMLAAQIESRGGTVVGRLWLGRDGATPELGAAAAIEMVRDERPTVIISGVDAAHAIPFARLLRKAGITAAELPTLHYAISESDVASFEHAVLADDYLIGATFASTPAPARDEFVQSVLAAGGEGFVGEEADAAFVATRLTAVAAMRSDALDRGGILSAIGDTRVRGPAGPVAIDHAMRAAWMTCRVGRISDSGQVTEVWHEETPRRPRAWPMWKSRAAWIAIAEGRIVHEAGAHP